MRCSHLRRRFRLQKTGHFRSCITRSRLEQRTKIGSCASPGQHQRRSARDLCRAQLVTEIRRNSSRVAFSRRTRVPGDPAENRMIVRNGTVMTGGIALSAARSKLHRHENAVRVVHVIAERFAMAKSASRVELASRLKSSHRAGLQTQAPISAPFRFSDDLLHHRACNAFAQVHGSRSHRLNLAMLRVQLFQCSTAEELTVFPNTPKGNVRAVVFPLPAPCSLLLAE